VEYYTALHDLKIEVKRLINLKIQQSALTLLISTHKPVAVFHFERILLAVFFLR